MIATQRRISVRLRDWPNHCPRLATVRCLEEVDGMAGRVRPQSKTSVLVDKVQSAEYTFRGLQQKVSVNVHPCCSGVMSPIDRDGRGRLGGRIGRNVGQGHGPPIAGIEPASLKPGREVRR